MHSVHGYGETNGTSMAALGETDMGIHTQGRGGHERLWNEQHTLYSYYERAGETTVDCIETPNNGVGIWQSSRQEWEHLWIGQGLGSGFSCEYAYTT